MELDAVSIPFGLSVMRSVRRWAQTWNWSKNRFCIWNSCMVYSHALHLLKFLSWMLNLLEIALELMCGDLEKFRTALHVYEMFEVSRKHVKWREDVWSVFGSHEMLSWLTESCCGACHRQCTVWCSQMGHLVFRQIFGFFLSMITAIDYDACILHAQNALKHFEGSLIMCWKDRLLRGKNTNLVWFSPFLFWVKMTYVAELNKPGFISQQSYEPERSRFGPHVFDDVCPGNSVSRLTFGRYF